MTHVSAYFILSHSNLITRMTTTSKNSKHVALKFIYTCTQNRGLSKKGSIILESDFEEKLFVCFVEIQKVVRSCLPVRGRGR